jgi:hypothetical protein
MAKKAPASTAPPTPAKGKALEAGRTRQAGHAAVGRPGPARLSQPGAPARLRDPVPGARVHLPLPADRPARLRAFHHRLHRRRAVHRTKSLKMYMWSYRNDGAFHEKVTNSILDDMVKAIQPRYLRITAKWYVRGGIYTNVVVEHRKKGWKPRPRSTWPAWHDRPGGTAGRAAGLPEVRRRRGAQPHRRPWACTPPKPLPRG